MLRPSQEQVDGEPKKRGNDGASRVANLVINVGRRRTPFNFSRRDSSPPQLSASCTLAPPLSLTRRGQSRRGTPRDRERCGARLVRVRQAGWGIWPAYFERPRRHRPRCVLRLPQPHNLRPRRPPQWFPYLQAYGSETAKTSPNGHAHRERATVIILMAEERVELEDLARSTKTEHRLRQRARIVLLAADGVASRAIGRAVGCTTGTASK
jgi:hypothetical protein